MKIKSQSGFAVTLLLHIFLQFLTATNSNAQSQGGLLEWGRIIGGKGLIREQWAKSLAVDQNIGDVYSVGIFGDSIDFDPGPGFTWGTTPVNPTYEGIFINKLSASGNHIWTKFITGSQNGEIISSGIFYDMIHHPKVLTDAIGNVYISGNFIGTIDFDPGPAVLNLVSGTSVPSGFIIKLDAQGNLIWGKNFTGPFAKTLISSFCIDDVFNVYSTGCFTGSVDFDPGAGAFNLSSSPSGCITFPKTGDIFINKIDAGGNFVWAKGITGTEKNISGEIQLDISGNIYLAGDYENCNGVNVDFNPGVGINVLPGSGSFILKLTNNGNFVWVQNTGGGSVGSIDIDPVGNIYQGYVNTISKSDNSLNSLWSINLTGTNSNAYIYNTYVDPLGFILVSGRYSGPIDFDPSSSTVSLPPAVGAFLSKYDDSGNLIWVKGWTVPNGSSNPPKINGLSSDQIGRVYLSGVVTTVSPFDIDPGAGVQLMTNLNEDLFILKLSPPCSNPSNSTVNITVCDSVVIQGITYTNDTTFTTTLLSNAGCDSIVTFNLNVEPTYAPTICLVTVDSSSNHNVIIYEKPAGLTSVDSFYVYREVGANVYQIVGALSDTSFSVFDDYAANPNSTSFKYKIASLNVCGQTSSQSPYHSTIHLQYLGAGNFQWTNYLIENVANPVLSYSFYRDNNSSGSFQLIQVIPGNNNTFTDVNYASYPNASYRVEVNWFTPVNCNPTSRIASSFSTSRSNILSFATTGTSELLTEYISVYPNPSNGNFSVEFVEGFSVLDGSRMQIVNSIGQIISTYYLNAEGNFTRKFFIEKHGLYFVQLTNQDGVIVAVKKIIIN